MKNPLEGMFGKANYQNTEAALNKNKEKVDDLEHPFGKRVMVGSSEGAEDIREIANSIFSIPNLPKIAWLKANIFAAKKKLEAMYSQNQSEAVKLNEKYDALLKKAEESGDTSEVEAFEKDKLGMEK